MTQSRCAYYPRRFEASRRYYVKVIPQHAEVAQGVPGRLRPRIFLTIGSARAVGRQPYAPVAFTPGEIPGTHFQGLSRPQGTWLRRGEPRKKSPVTPRGIDPGTSRLVAQCLNHYATPGPFTKALPFEKLETIHRTTYYQTIHRTTYYQTIHRTTYYQTIHRTTYYQTPQDVSLQLILLLLFFLLIWCFQRYGDKVKSLYAL